MSEFSPSWETIAASFGAKLRTAAGVVQVYDRYPDNPISSQDLAAIVITEPEFSPTSFTFGAVTVAYTGILDIPIIALSTGQAEISKSDANQCRQLGLNIHVLFHTNRALDVAGKKAFVNLANAKIIRLSPPAGGHYAGLEIPYTVTIQYASN
jgi:hypothetical protein